MIHSRKRWKPGAVMLGSCMLLGISTASIAETQLSVENDGMALTAIVSSSKDILSTSIRVVGPNGFVFEDRFEDSTLQWVPEGNLADGRYNWEVRTVTVTPGAPIIEISAPQAPAPNPTGQQGAGESSTTPANPEQPAVEIPIERYFEEADKGVHTESGSFEVRGGLMVPNVNEQEAISQIQPARPGLLGSIAGAVLDFVFPSAHADQVIADDLTLEDLSPCLRYDDTSTIGTDWNACGWDGDGFFIIEGGSTLASNAQFAIENSASASSLYVRSNGNIGFGTNTPLQPLHIVDGLPTIRFDDTTDPQVWDLEANGNFGGGFVVRDVTGGNTTPFRIEVGAPTNALRIDASGNVGIGTDPDRNLHIKSATGSVRQRWDNSAAEYWEFWHGGSAIFWQHFDGTTTTTPVKFNDTAPTNSLVVASGGIGVGTSVPSVAIDAVRSSGGPDLSMFRLENDGGNRFEFVNTRPGVGGEWQFINSSNPDGADLVIRELTSNPQEEFRLEQNGNLTISGTLTQGSSRTIKSNIVPLSGSTVLANLEKIEFAEWSYDNSPSQRHAGPMAEEFHEVFGLGPDNKHIAPGDMAGLALAAAKALVEQNEQQQDRIQAQEERITELESQNQAIRSSLHELQVLRVEVEQLKASWPSVLVALEN